MIAPWKDEKVRMMYQRPEIRASVEIILSIFTVLILLFIAIRPTLNIVATLQKKIDDQSVVDKKLSNKISQLIKATADLSTYASNLSLFSLAVTDGSLQGGVAKRIEVLAVASGVSINGLSLDAVPLLGSDIDLSDKTKEKKPATLTGTSVASFSINFDVSGSQDQLLDFLGKLENLDRVVIINNVSFKKQVSKDDKGAVVNTIQLTGKASAYYVI